MADKGLSPRQKMINLMYLVLTALLALNVSAEVLNAFVLIDKSIRQSTENVNKENRSIYGEFEKAKKLNPEKVGEWFDKAIELRGKTDALDSLIQDYKKELAVAADGKGANPTNIEKKSDNNVGGEVMIVKGRGENLKKEIKKYRDFCIGLISDTAKSNILTKNIKTTLSTDPIESTTEPGTYKDWTEANFNHLPLIAVVAMMSKMQNDIRNVESDLLSYLLGQIGKEDYSFNVIEAIVNAPNSYVKIGEEFKAEVFIAAYDSTKDPKIVLNDGTELPVKSGKGIYNPGTGSPGKFTWGGKIVLRKPGTGDTVSFPFENTYQVVAPTYAISATKMNVFYIGVKNPVAVTATGKEISATISGSGGKMTRTGAGKYNVTVRNRGTATVSVIADGQKMGSMKFRCLPVPDPYAVVAGRKGGLVPKSTLLAQSIVKAKLDNFVFDLSFPITSFTVSATIQGFTEEYRTTGAQITAQQKGLIRQLKRGDKVYFERIKARAPDGTTRELGSISFKLQ